MLRKLIVLAALGTAAATVLVGCNSKPPAESPGQSKASGEPKATASKAADEEHGHKPGTHGGIIVPLGRDSYHVEAVLAKGGAVRLYTLGKDEARVQEVEAQELVGYVTVTGGTEAAEEVKFVSQPQTGDPAGKTSLFVGQLPAALQGKSVQVTINNIRVGGERFRVAFSNEPTVHYEAPMPPTKDNAKARALHLTPGGKYTAADVAANGGTTPAQKYKGFKSDHNASPKPGDTLCPISATKASPKLTWVVGGKTYAFCCLPCVDEFVELAKTKPDEILDPSAYVKK